MTGVSVVVCFEIRGLICLIVRLLSPDPPDKGWTGSMCVCVNFKSLIPLNFNLSIALVLQHILLLLGCRADYNILLLFFVDKKTGSNCLPSLLEVRKKPSYLPCSHFPGHWSVSCWCDCESPSGFFFIIIESYLLNGWYLFVQSLAGGPVLFPFIRCRILLIHCGLSIRSQTAAISEDCTT